MKLIGQTNLSSEHRFIKALLATGLFLGLLTLFLVPPTDLPFTACTFRSITGHSCLTCGLTRSLHTISHGELTASLRYHMFGPVVFIGMLLSLIAFAMEALTGRRFAMQPSRKQKVQFFVPFAIIWLVFWSVRLITEHLSTSL